MYPACILAPCHRKRTVFLKATNCQKSVIVPGLLMQFSRKQKYNISDSAYHIKNCWLSSMEDVYRIIKAYPWMMDRDFKVAKKRKNPLPVEMQASIQRGIAAPLRCDAKTVTFVHHRCVLIAAPSF